MQLKRVSPDGVPSDLAKLCCLSATASHAGQPGQTLSLPEREPLIGVEAWRRGSFSFRTPSPGPFSLTVDRRPSPIVWQSDVDLAMAASSESY